MSLWKVYPSSKISDGLVPVLDEEYLVLAALGLGNECPRGDSEES